MDEAWERGAGGLQVRNIHKCHRIRVRIRIRVLSGSGSGSGSRSRAQPGQELKKPFTTLGCHTFCHGYGSDTTRLCANDVAVFYTAFHGVVKNKLRYLVGIRVRVRCYVVRVRVGFRVRVRKSQGQGQGQGQGLGLGHLVGVRVRAAGPVCYE